MTDGNYLLHFVIAYNKLRNNANNENIHWARQKQSEQLIIILMFVHFF